MNLLGPATCLVDVWNFDCKVKMCFPPILIELDACQINRTSVSLYLDGNNSWPTSMKTCSTSYLPLSPLELSIVYNTIFVYLFHDFPETHHHHKHPIKITVHNVVPEYAIILILSGPCCQFNQCPLRHGYN